MNKFAQRFMFPSEDLLCIVGKDNKYSVYGPAKSNGDYAALIMAVIEILNITMNEFRKIIVEYYNGRPIKKSEFFDKTGIVVSS